LNQLLPFSSDDPNNKANSSDDDGVIKKEDWPIDNGMDGMSRRPVAQIGWRRRPTYVPRQLFHGGVGIAIGWGHRATIAGFDWPESQLWHRGVGPFEYDARGVGIAAEMKRFRRVLFGVLVAGYFAAVLSYLRLGVSVPPIICFLGIGSLAGVLICSIMFLKTEPVLTRAALTILLVSLALWFLLLAVFWATGRA
jgi:hypothetical protein